VLADAVPYTGHTTEGRPIVVQVRGRVVVRVRVSVVRYPCDTFGDVGPIVVREAVHARIAADGRFHFTAGEPAQRVTVAGRVRRAGGGSVRGTLRVRGSIATGQRCASATLRFAAAR
jgi:hypothetical protein